MQAAFFCYRNIDLLWLFWSLWIWFSISPSNIFWFSSGTLISLILIFFSLVKEQVCNLPDGIQKRWAAGCSSMQTSLPCWLWHQMAYYQQGELLSGSSFTIYFLCFGKQRHWQVWNHPSFSCRLYSGANTVLKIWRHLFCVPEKEVVLFSRNCLPNKFNFPENENEYRIVPRRMF